VIVCRLKMENGFEAELKLNSTVKVYVCDTPSFKKD
jgi:hypothetical protein